MSETEWIEKLCYALQECIYELGRRIPQFRHDEGIEKQGRFLARMQEILRTRPDDTDKDILRTRCGCERRIQIAPGVRVIQVPIPEPRKAVWVEEDSPVDLAPTYGTRTFCYAKTDKAGRRVFEEERIPGP